MHEILVNRLGGLTLPRKSVVKLTDRPDMTLDVYRGRKTTVQQQYQHLKVIDYGFSNRLVPDLPIKSGKVFYLRTCSNRRALLICN